ncbi:TonB-dependent receptor plug domain-containing protein [Aquimarina sediminis]|uniref:TonB-dependent receptor plug domain-containing protein n=1 Tax=Aquimarina sediminis TaxID=2070536 RepID=UPI000CA08DED|nr:TonB-dependent receptor [Aquimarina sediminis]
MKKLTLLYLSLLVGVITHAQDHSIHQKETDTLVTHLDEITVVGRRKLSNYRQEKTLSSIDEYLEKSNRVTMIKRGNYAWEPTLNNMASDRLSVTIDGMQIFGACTDKMDPITSYVDVSNLEKVTIASGQEGTENANAIGGGIDLKLPESKYYNTGLKSSVDLGYETNGNYKTTGADLVYSGNRLYISGDGIYRKSDNYDAGGNQEINYSQFKKYNISLQAGYKLSDHDNIDATFIYDKATDIGYPALPMDVSLAKATIGAIAYTHRSESTFVKNWETKLYFNTITHIMDDSKRPDVPIRMDMPGWSDTYGLYSKIKAKTQKHQLSFNLNAHYNRSLAEMTMYPNDPNENIMFMYTWPDIRTYYTSIYAKDQFYISTKEKLSFTARLGYQTNKIKKETGLESLQIFYPQISDSKSRILTSFSANYTLKHKKTDFSVGLGYGERAPSVSEGYGFFLFNSFDNYDYIGNPTLKNEKSAEVNFKTNYNHKNFKIGIEASYFHIYDYIIGQNDDSLSPMTIGANGVRVYNSLQYASIFNTFLNASYTLNKTLSLNTSVGYHYGKGSDHNNLPLISPISYLAEVNYSLKSFNAALQVNGNTNQGNHSVFYGEDQTAAFAILNLNLGNTFFIKDNKLILKYGIENILDTHYSTYADWNNIPRQGRNFYINTSYVIQ